MQSYFPLLCALDILAYCVLISCVDYSDEGLYSPPLVNTLQVTHQIVAVGLFTCRCLYKALWWLCTLAPNDHVSNCWQLPVHKILMGHIKWILYCQCLKHACQEFPRVLPLLLIRINRTELFLVLQSYCGHARPPTLFKFCDCVVVGYDWRHKPIAITAT